MLSFDRLLETRIKMGRGQYIQLGITSIIGIQTGFSLHFMVLILQALRIQNGYNDYQMMFIACSFYVGIGSGNLTAINVMGYIGRRILIPICLIGQTIIICSQMLHKADFYSQTLMRFFFGFFFQPVWLICQIKISEIVVTKSRGKFQSLQWVSFTLGTILSYLISSLFFLDFEHVNLQIFAALILPLFITNIVLGVYFLNESPRYLLSELQFCFAFRRINEMLEANGESYLETDEKDNLVMWGLNTYSNQPKKISVTELFRGDMCQKTILFWLITIVWNVSSNMMIIVLPYLFNRAGTSIKYLMLVYFFELLGLGTSMLIVDRQGVTRIGFMTWATFFYLIAIICIFQFKDNFIILFALMLRFLDRMIWVSWTFLATESYTTRLRTFAVSVGDSLGKFCVSFGIILFYFYEVDTTTVEIMCFFIVLCIIQMITLFFYPVDKASKTLDDGQDMIKDS